MRASYLAASYAYIALLLEVFLFGCIKRIIFVGVAVTQLRRANCCLETLKFMPLILCLYLAFMAISCIKCFVS